MIVRLLASLTILVAVSVITALLLLLPGHHGLNFVRAVLALVMGVLAAATFYVQESRRKQLISVTETLVRRRFSPWTIIMFGAIAIFGFSTYCWLIYHDGDEVKIGSPNNLGDLSLHLLMTNDFAQGVHWWPDHPEHAWVPLRYYPGIDLFQSLLNVLGTDEICGLVWVGLLGTFALALALYEWGGSFTMAGFLFSGGLAGFQVLKTGIFADYQAPLAWKSLPLAIFVTQRSFLFALPAGLLLMTHWRRKFFSRQAPLLLSRSDDIEEPQPSPGLIPFWVEALLYTVMPVMHLFTFVFLSLLLGWWLVTYFSRAAMRRHLICLLAVALLPAIGEVFLMTGFSGGSMVHLHFGWMREEGQSFLGFWLLNFGFFGPLAIACWVRSLWNPVNSILTDDDTRWTSPKPRPRDDGSTLAAEAFVIPAGLIFILACIVMLTVWEWDNTKIMLWCYLAALPFMWQYWIAPLRSLARWPICFVLFFSGFVCLVGGLKGEHGAGYELAVRSELDAVQFAVQPLSIEARFAAAPEYNHPLVSAGGNWQWDTMDTCSAKGSIIRLWRLI